MSDETTQSLRLEMRELRAALEEARHELAERSDAGTQEPHEEAHRLAGLGSWALELGTGTLSWSSRVVDLLGLPKEQEPSLSAFEAAFHAADRAAFVALLDVVRDDGTDRAITCHLARPGREGRMVQLRVTHQPTEAGAPGRLLGTVQDVTEQLGELRHRHLFESGLLGVAYVDTRGRITDANDRFLEMVGFTRADLESGDVEWRRLAPDQPVPGERLAGASPTERGPPGIAVEWELRRKDGIPIPVLVSFSSLDDPSFDAVCYVLDDTERRRMQTELQRNQRLDSVGRLAGGIAHDFNNLLTIIRMCAQFLEEGIHREDPLAEDVSAIVDATERAADLTHQLLAFSRKQVLAPQIVDLNSVLDGMTGLLRRVLGEDVSLRIAAADDLWTISADPTQLEQVLMNLSVNAREAMPDGGTLEIATANVSLEAELASGSADLSTGPFVRLNVSDTGLGIPKQDLDRIFDPFFTSKDESHGTGLGLAMVFGIVKQSGGLIRVHSEPGQGTRFELYFPQVSGAPTPRKTRPSLGAPRGMETVLVAEDEPVVRSVVRRTLESAGYHVLVAEDGEAAVALSDRYPSPIQLLVTDVIMPGMSGPTLAHRLQASRPALKVLYVSGYSYETLGQRGTIGEGTRFLGKPFRPEDLLAEVRRALQG